METLQMSGVSSPALLIIHLSSLDCLVVQRAKANKSRGTFLGTVLSTRGGRRSRSSVSTPWVGIMQPVLMMRI